MNIDKGLRFLGIKKKSELVEPPAAIIQEGKTDIVYPGRLGSEEEVKAFFKKNNIDFYKLPFTAYNTSMGDEGQYKFIGVIDPHGAFGENEYFVYYKDGEVIKVSIPRPRRA